MLGGGGTAHLEEAARPTPHVFTVLSILQVLCLPELEEQPRQKRVCSMQRQVIIGSGDGRRSVGTRTARPGQTLSSSARLAGQKRQQDEAAGTSNGRGGHKTHAQKMEAKAAAFQRARPHSQDEYVRSFPSILELHKDIVEAVRGLVQKRIDDAEAAVRSAYAGVALGVRKRRSVVCFHDGFRFVLNVPHLGSPTSEVFTVHPCSLGYAPIAPSDNCETWIHMDTIMRFKSMHLNGLSATSEPCRLGLISGCCHALTLSNRCVQSSRTPSRSRSGSTPLWTCGRGGHSAAS